MAERDRGIEKLVFVFGGGEVNERVGAVVGAGPAP